MIKSRHTLTSILRSAISLLLLLAASQAASAQGFLKWQADSIPLFRGVAVGFDLAGAAQRMLSDYGQYEVMARVNLHDQYFPTVEVGYGEAKHEDDAITGITYSTKAPYFRIGADVNLLKNKHTGNRVFAGLRYAFTSYKVDISSLPFKDPVWQWDTSYGVKDESCSQHWAELLFGIEAKVAARCTWDGALAIAAASPTTTELPVRRGMCRAMARRKAPAWAIRSTSS